jgi:endoribonuclease LACTB2
VPTHIVNVGYDSTNYYVVDQNSVRLLVDVGMPGTLPRLLANLKRKDISVESIQYLLCTHYHPDHAGIAQDLKARGVRLIVLETQKDAIPGLQAYMKPSQPFVQITLHDNLDVSIGESRTFLRKLGIAGEIVSTPGHSDDSVTLVLDTGDVFTGDLISPALASSTNSEILVRIWDTIRAMHATRIHPGHGPVRPLSELVK